MIVDQKQIVVKDQTIGNLNLRLDGIMYDKTQLTNQVKSFK